MRPCTQVLAGGPKFHGYTLPLYALFGDVSGQFYICRDLFPRKDGYYNILLWNGFRYVDATTKECPEIRRWISRYMHSDSFIRKKCIAQNHGALRRKAMREEREMLREVCPHERKPQVLQGRTYGSSTKPEYFSNGQKISVQWDEIVRIDEPMRSYGLPVEYGSRMPKATQNGVLLTTKSFDELREEEPHKDHMKVKQTKIRPEKTQSRKIVIRRNNVEISSYTEEKIK